MAKKEISEYYDSGIESQRLFEGVFQLERVRTQEIILRYLTGGAFRILDMGGGTGFYSFWLSEMGHEVHLIDPVPVHIEQAKKHLRESRRSLASIRVGEARQIEFEDNHFDIVLFFGPLYHITERRERIRALTEANRVLGKGGLIFCVGISRYASLLDGFFRNLVADPYFVGIMKRDLRDGQHRNPKGTLEYFTTAYFHRPEELREEITEAGFKLQKLLAVDGFGWLLPDFDSKWEDVSYQRLLLESIRVTEEEDPMIGISAHIMAIATKD
jgi:ubiquinone/menaquinone biosynthesis C-methylase UbiE